MYKRFAKAYFTGAQSDGDGEDHVPEEPDDDEIVEQEDVKYESKFYMTFV